MFEGLQTKMFKLASLLSILRFSSALPVFQSPLVNTCNGTIAGLYIEEYNQDAYLGIPYAEPPVGPLRFEKPRPYNHSWLTVETFDSYGPACYETGGTDTIHLPHSEDCLSLNIVKPHGEYENLPVSIWIHGGSFNDGSGSRPAYNLSFIVDNGVKIGKPFVGITINYRLGGFGYLNSQESVGKGLTNVGLRDQLKAIEWVHENIKAFGGNPDHIVLWGESAGAISIGHLQFSGYLKPYVKGLIMESGSVPYANHIGYAPGNQTDYDQTVQYCNCTGTVDTLECLKTVPAETLQYVWNITNGVNSDSFSPYLDGDVIPAYGTSLLKEGSFFKAPILIGTNTDEGSSFVETDLETTAQFEKYIADRFPYVPNVTLEKLAELYPLGDPAFSVPLDPTYNITPVTYPDTYGAQYPRLATLVGDLAFVAISRLLARTLSDYDVPVYKYRFNIPDLGTENSSYLGCTHYQEVVYVLDNDQRPADDTLGSTWNSNQNSPLIAKTMSKMWAQFISDLNPNFDDFEYNNENFASPQWPAYIESASNMVFDLNGFYVEDDTFRLDAIDYVISVFQQFELFHTSILH